MAFLDDLGAGVDNALSSSGSWIDNLTTPQAPIVAPAGSQIQSINGQTLITTPNNLVEYIVIGGIAIFAVILFSFALKGRA